MSESVKKANAVKLKTVAKNMENRNFEAVCCETAAEACEKALALIPGGASVGLGGSVTVREIGLLAKLKSREDVTVLEASAPPSPAEAFAHFQKTLATDVFLMSANAVTMDGELVNIDGTGNRLAALLMGPKEVIIIAGVNKIVESADCAVARIRTDACPPNAIRLNKKTSCALVGKCVECLFSETMCCHTVVTRYNRIDGRVKVILVNENLGY